MIRNLAGAVMVASLSLVACHNIFNKDKARPVTDAAAAVPVVATSPEEVKETIDAPVAVTKPVESRDSSLKYIYLTFDDGPDAGTLNCYNTCKAKGVKATFFLVGEHAAHKAGRQILDSMRKDLRRAMLANHSYTHAAHNRYEQFYKNPAEALNDFLRVHDSLRFDVPVARFPGNNVWVVDSMSRTTKLTRPLSKLMDSIGYTVLGWDVEWKFNRKNEPIQSAEQMAQEVIVAAEKKTSLVKNHVVLLAHDRMFKEPQFRDSLVKMISILQQQKGYIFETADKYPRIKRYDRSVIAARK